MADLPLPLPPFEAEPDAAPATEPLRDLWRAFRQNRGAVVGLAFLGLVLVVAVFADFIAPHSPIEQFRDSFLKPPVWQGGSPSFLLGTDAVGRDILSRLIYGACYSLFIGAVVVAFGLVIGVTIGLIAGYARGLVDAAIMRAMDIILAFPALLLALVMVAVLGPSLWNAMIAIAITLQPHYVRLTRGVVLAERGKDYVVAARVAGAGPWRLMFRTILPNVMAPLIVQAALSFSDAILNVAALGFLNQGAQPPTPEWGTMLADAREFILSAWWVVTFPGLAILLVVLAINLVGDGLRDALDPEAPAKLMALLEIEGLSVDFATQRGAFRAVEDVSMMVDAGDVQAIVGKSGSGKSVAMLAVMGLLPWSARVTAARLSFDGNDLRGLSRRERRRIVGKNMAMVFQEPMTSLNPCFTVGFQIAETLRVHLGLGRAERRARTLALLRDVGIPDAERRARAFPHQLSGGMNQRVMIAMAIACRPKLLIADEPTTALDVTIQAQILDLLLTLQRETGMALTLITHDMGVVAETAERVAVLYAGRKVEEQAVAPLFADPHHPYTAALLATLPERAITRRLPAIAGTVPGQFNRPPACQFAPRCAFATNTCRTVPPPRQDAGLGLALCHYPLVRGRPLGHPVLATEPVA